MTFLQIIFPALLCLMAFVGYLVFYLESQQYTAREVVLRGLRWHSLACVLAAVLLVAGQSLVGAARTDGGTAELAQLKEKLATLESKNSALVDELAVAESAREKAVIAAEDSAKAEQKLAAQHAEVMADLALAKSKAAVATTAKIPAQVEVPLTKMVAAEMKLVPRDMVAELQRVRRSLGDSINPAYRPDLPSKRVANGLIQQALQRLGSYGGELNADGLATKEAVQAYQAAKDLPQTGIVASRTARAMERDFQSLYTVASADLE